MNLRRMISIPIISSSDVDYYFGITHDFRHYHPSSAYQTPIYNLLKTDLKLTLDFIIEFTNVATEKYASSSLDKNEVETVTVYSQRRKNYQAILLVIVFGACIEEHR